MIGDFIDLIKAQPLGDTICQFYIMTVGITSFFMMQSHKEGTRAFAPLLGLSTQPFWFYTTMISFKWGIFISCVFYTLGWMKGIYTYWFMPLRGVPKHKRWDKTKKRAVWYYRSMTV